MNLRHGRLSAGLIGAFALIDPTLPALANDPPSASPWTIERSTIALTGAASVIASLTSTEPLHNQIGQPERAILVLRCTEGAMAAYVAWPQVLPIDTTNFGGRPQTMVLFRIDDAPIRYDFWIRSDDGTGVGGFDTHRATHIASQIITAHRFVIRLTGSETQDAVFELADISRVASEVGAACGVRWTAAR